MNLDKTFDTVTLINIIIEKHFKTTNDDLLHMKKCNAQVKMSSAGC